MQGKSVNVSFTADDFLHYHPGGAGIVTWSEWELYPELQTPELGYNFSLPWWYADAIPALQESNAHGVRVIPTISVRAEDLQGRALPLWFRADTGPGCFAVNVTLWAGQDCPEALLFTSRRRLVWRGALAAGQCLTVHTLCDVSPIYPAGVSGLTDSSPGCKAVNSVDVTLVGKRVRLQSVDVCPAAVPRLFLMGDSTVTDQPSPVFYAPGACYAGWGQMLPAFVGGQWCVSNHAHSGLSTESFRTEGHYENMWSLLRPGDAVLMQFGHNDQKWRHLAADTGYRENLARYIDELRALGARPVLVTPLARNTWKSADAYNDLLAEHSAAVLALGKEKDVPVIDLHAWMMAEIRAVGMRAARRWFHPCDYTHLNDFGAYRAAGFVAGELRRLGFLTADTPSLPGWPVHAPMEALKPPPDWQLRGLKRPENDKPLVDYGLIADFPWPVQ